MCDKYQRTLLALGIPANLSGFAYIAAAGKLIESDPDLYCVASKALYYDVAARFHTSPNVIEKGIRYAINCGDIDKYKTIMNVKKAVPSNMQFLFGLYYHMTE